jgi:integrase
MEFDMSTAVAKAPAPRKRPFKFSDPFMRDVKLPPGKRELYKSETLERGVSLRAVIGKNKKTWYASIFQDGKTVQTPIGNWPELHVKDARDACRDWYKNQDRREHEKKVGTVADVVANFLEARIDGRVLTAREVRRKFEKIILPAWGDWPFAAIKRADTATLLSKIPGDAMANSVWTVLSSLFVYQQDFMPEGWQPPISRSMKRKGLKPRQRTLSLDELKIVWQACDELGEFGRFVKFLFYCAQRRTTALEMQWTQLKGDEWHTSRQDRQKGVPAVIKLPAAAMALIEAQKDCTAYRGDPRGRIWHCRALSKGKARLDAKIAALDTEGVMKGRWTLHDCRRSSRTYLGRIKDVHGRALVLPHVAEACLGHKLKLTATQDTYDVNDYQEEIGQALELLAAYIAKVTGENVVALPVRAA